MRYGHLAESSYKISFSTPTFCVSPNSMVAIYLIFCMRGWHKNITPFSTIFTFIAGPTFSAKDSPTLFLRECVNSGHIGLPTLDLGVLYATPCCSWRRNRAPEKKIKYWVRLPVFLLSQTVANCRTWLPLSSRPHIRFAALLSIKGFSRLLSSFLLAFITSKNLPSLCFEIFTRLWVDRASR